MMSTLDRPAIGDQDDFRPQVFLLGNGPTSPSAFRSLQMRCDLIGVATDNPTTAVLASEHAIPVFTPKTVLEVRSILSNLKPPLTIVSSFDKTLDAETISHCKFINVHFSLLPAYRGRANVNWAMINGETACGISFHFIDENIDTGNLLYQSTVEIAQRDTVDDVYRRLNQLQEQFLGETVVRAAKGDPGWPQERNAATYCCGRLPEDGLIDWSCDATAISRLVRALGGTFPSAFTFLNGRRLDIPRVTVSDALKKYVGCVPGRVVSRSKRNGVVEVLTGNGTLFLHHVVVEGRAIPAADVVTTTRSTLGMTNGRLLLQMEDYERRLGVLERKLAELASAATADRQV